MASTLAWLDHSESQRKRMMEIVALFREKGTVDELGIGSVRDALSETLFPGGSVLHTRARYLLFIPWLCRRIEEDRVSSKRAIDRLRDYEVQLIDALLRGSEDKAGIIGRDVRASLKQMPSFAYWGALGRYGIRQQPGTRSQWARSLDAIYVRQRAAISNDEGDRVSGVGRYWHAHLPVAPVDLLEVATVALASHEAEYLADRIKQTAPRSFLSHLVTRASDPIEAEFPWMVPDAVTASDEVKEHLEHARNLSEVMHGAQLLYNLILSEEVEKARTAGGEVAFDGDRTEEYRDALGDWVGLMGRRANDHGAWDRTRFWQLVLTRNTRIPVSTRRFVKAWLDLAIFAYEEVADDDRARDLIVAREIQVKRGLARVRNHRALERWSGASGTTQLAYRWPQFRRVVFDIAAGLRALRTDRA